MATECYHSPGRIATSFISGLWLGWGFPYYYKWVGPEALKEQSAMSVRSQGLSSITRLTTKVQQPLSFINVTTILGLQVAITEKSQRHYLQNAVGKRSL